MNRTNSRLVYSDQAGRICPGCEKAVAKCSCKQNQKQPSGDGVVRIERQTKGRKGKGVTLITGVPLATEELKILAKSLKQQCGSGGTVKNGVIEIQGDHRDQLLELLTEKGWNVKKAGG